VSNKPSFDPPLVITDLNNIIYNRDSVRNFSTFVDFVKSSGEYCNYLFEKSGVKIVYDNNSDQYLVIQRNGVVFSCCPSRMTGGKILELISCENPPPVCGVIIDNTIINNGDDNSDYEFEVSPLTSFGNSFGDDYKFITLSFETVANLFGMNDDDVGQNYAALRVAEAFIEKLIIRDFVKEETISLTQPQREALIKYRQGLNERDEKLIKSKKFIKKQEQLAKKLKAPAGFTLDQHERAFHRPGTVIVENLKTKEFGLFGMDESSYFGVILPHKVGNINEAFESLVPDGAKGLDYFRQGEWLFVSVSAEEQDSLNDEAKTLNVPVVHGVTLPLESHESNPHILTFGFDFIPDMICNIEDDGMDDAGEERVRKTFNETYFIVRPLKKVKKGGFKFDMFARNFICYHVDHAKLESLTHEWKRILKNTALRSVSAKRNVD
jgi:hypothetical protein